MNYASDKKVNKAMNITELPKTIATVCYVITQCLKYSLPHPQMFELLGFDVAGRGQHAGHRRVCAGGGSGAEDGRALNPAVFSHRCRHLAICR